MDNFSQLAATTPKVAKNCQKMSENVQSCQKLSIVVQRRQKTPKVAPIANEFGQ